METATVPPVQETLRTQVPRTAQIRRETYLADVVAGRAEAEKRLGFFQEFYVEVLGANPVRLESYLEKLGTVKGGGVGNANH